MKSKDGSRPSRFAQILNAVGSAGKAVGKIAKDTGIATLAADKLAEVAKGAAGPAYSGVIDGARGVLKTHTGTGFGHRMAGRGRKTSKSGKEYPSNVGSNAQVWHGTKEKTPGGLTKNDLMKTSKGRIVSKKKHAQGLKQFNKPGVKEAFRARMFKKA
jgi:hypothetical protein